MRPILQSALAFGAVALFLAAPAPPLQAAPGSQGRAGPAGAVQSGTGPEAIPVHDRWGYRHRRHGRHHGYPEHRRFRHRPYRHQPNRHRHYPYWGYLYWGFPHPCIVARPWPRGHWRHHRHRRTRGHRHPVPRHRHVRCRGGFTVVLPLPYPPRYYR